MAKQTTQKLTRAQIKAGLDTIPVETLLSSGTGKTPQLTAKQRAFAYAVALGKPKAQAYRETYKADPAPSTIVNAPYVLAKDARIQQEIEAYKLAIEAEKHRTPAQLKALLVQQLVAHSLDNDFPPASRVQCLKLLGSLYDVGAFVERKEITTVNRSDDIRTRLMDRLRTVTIDTVQADDALDLLAEIQGSRQPADPTVPVPPHSGPSGQPLPTHTIPLKRSEEESEEELKQSQESDVIDDFDKL
jgi:hypothetical protein